MNRLGIASVIDAGGGGQNYPDDYAVIEKLHEEDQLTVRIHERAPAVAPSDDGVLK